MRTRSALILKGFLIAPLAMITLVGLSAATGGGICADPVQPGHHDYPPR